MKTLTVHVGTHKTGTTSLQGFLWANKAELAARGIDYPTEGSYYRPHNGHSWLVHALAGTRPSWVKPHVRLPDRAECVAAIRSRLRDSTCPNGLVSSEHFFTHITPRLLHETFAGLAETTRILVFLRPQDEFLESRYAHRTRVGRHARSLDDFVGAELADPEGYCVFHRALCRLADAFGAENIEVRTFHGRQPRQRVFADLCDALGLALDDGLALPAVRNASPPAALVRAMAAIQAHVDGGQVRRATLNKRLARVWPVPPAAPRERLLSLDAARRIRAHFAADNARVARDFTAGRPLFDPLPDAPWPVADAPSTQLLVDLGLALWTDLRDARRAVGDDIRRLTAQRDMEGAT